MAPLTDEQRQRLRAARAAYSSRRYDAPWTRNCHPILRDDMVLTTREGRKLKRSKRPQAEGQAQAEAQAQGQAQTQAQTQTKTQKPEDSGVQQVTQKLAACSLEEAKGNAPMPITYTHPPADNTSLPPDWSRDPLFLLAANIKSDGAEFDGPASSEPSASTDSATSSYARDSLSPTLTCSPRQPCTASSPSPSSLGKRKAKPFQRASTEPPEPASISAARARPSRPMSQPDAAGDSIGHIQFYTQVEEKGPVVRGEHRLPPAYGVYPLTDEQRAIKDDDWDDMVAAIKADATPMPDREPNLNTLAHSTDISLVDLSQMPDRMAAEDFMGEVDRAARKKEARNPVPGHFAVDMTCQTQMDMIGGAARFVLGATERQPVRRRMWLHGVATMATGGAYGPHLDAHIVCDRINHEYWLYMHSAWRDRASMGEFAEWFENWTG